MKISSFSRRYGIAIRNRGDGYFYDAVMWIGIYQTISNLREAYYNAVEEMKKEQRVLMEEYGIQDSGVQYAIEHEKVMIHVFDETSGNGRGILHLSRFLEKRGKCRM